MILGCVQGLTEFLPVSSSGHLVLMQHLLGLKGSQLAFDVLVHLATFLAVLVYFWADIVHMIRSFLPGAPARLGGEPAPYWRRLVYLIIIGSIPAGLAGVGLKHWFEQLFTSPQAAAMGLIATGFILWGAEALARRQASFSLGRLGWGRAFLVGVGQAVAIIPGVSRSGSTIAFALGSGLKREDAARFSFLLALPAILGAGVLQAKDIALAGLAGQWPAFLAGFLTALVAGWLAIATMMRFIRRQPLTWFSPYVWLVGILALYLLG
ncbi:MAG: undecaprenyl-diphosphate phosphatase [Firmicutes bacterium]|nr:undecaprenyl-diphosphate phosphatase [Bacillota bacterium]